MERGFTLIELIVVLVVGGMILAIGVPTFRSTIQNNRIGQQINDLHLSMNLARSEALKRGEWVTVCRSSDMGRCSSGADWNSGWIVFVDDDRNGDRAANERLIRTVGLLGGSNTLALSSGSAWIAFTPTGESLGSGGLGVFALCDDRGVSHARGLVLRRTGSVRVTRDATEIGACS